HRAAVLQRQRAHGHDRRPGVGGGAAAGRRARPGGHRLHPAAGQAGGHRHRERAQGAGRRHGQGAARPGRGPDPGRHRRRPGGGPLPPQPRRPHRWERGCAGGGAGRRLAGPGRPDLARAGQGGRPVIASLRGRVLELLDDGAVLEVGGVGYRVHLTPKAAAALPRDGEVLVHTVTYVREDTLALYGFATTDERPAFEQLLSATGVGPKLALAVLAVHSPDALRRAVTAGDADALTLVSGVGRKAPD